MVDKRLRKIISDYSQASRRIDKMNGLLVRITAIRKDRLNKAISQIKALFKEEEKKGKK